MTYFAYGSNMNSARIAARLPCARRLGVGYIQGWTVTERLYADIDRFPRKRVWGVLYDLSVSDVVALDRFEGFPTVYADRLVTVHVGSRTVVALTYVMTEQTKRERDGKPYPEYYRQLCSAGARQNGIPDAFVVK